VNPARRSLRCLLQALESMRELDSTNTNNNVASIIVRGKCVDLNFHPVFSSQLPTCVGQLVRRLAMRLSFLCEAAATTARRQEQAMPVTDDDVNSQ